MALDKIAPCGIVVCDGAWVLYGPLSYQRRLISGTSLGDIKHVERHYRLANPEEKIRILEMMVKTEREIHDRFFWMSERIFCYYILPALSCLERPVITGKTKWQIFDGLVVDFCDGFGRVRLENGGNCPSELTVPKGTLHASYIFTRGQAVTVVTKEISNQYSVLCFKPSLPISKPF